MKILITGASRGIGKAEASLLAQQGHELFLTASTLDSFAEPVAGATLLGVDVSEADFDVKLAEALSQKTDRIDVLVNNVGVMVMKRFADLSREEIDQTLDVNLRSALLTTRAALPFLKKSEAPQVVFMSSMAAKSYIVGESVYSATKAALSSFAAVLRNEMGPHMKISTIHCWGVNTFGSDEKTLLEPENIAEALDFILSRDKDVLVESIDLGHIGQWRGGEAPWSPK